MTCSFLYMHMQYIILKLFEQDVIQGSAMGRASRPGNFRPRFSNPDFFDLEKNLILIPELGPEKPVSLKTYRRIS